MKRIFPMKINEINSQISVRNFTKKVFLEVDSKDKTQVSIWLAKATAVAKGREHPVL